MTEIFVKIGKFMLIFTGMISIICFGLTSLEAQTPPSVQSQTAKGAAVIPELPNAETLGAAVSGQRGVGTSRIQLIALLTDTGPQILEGVAWRIFTSTQGLKLIEQSNVATPTVELSPGTYLINSAFGRAHLTRLIRVVQGDNRIERFVINAGGLRVIIKSSSANFSEPVNATFDLLDDERDQFGNRQNILSNMRPGRITRLNSGIYQIISRLGDANAVVTSEVTVEAGKLTEATVLHEAAKVTFKLVQQTGGDALADAEWVIMTRSGKIVKETAGALPTHVLAPGDYTISARWAGRLYTRTFAIKSGENVEVEVVIQ